MASTNETNDLFKITVTNNENNFDVNVYSIQGYGEGGEVKKQGGEKCFSFSYGTDVVVIGIEPSGEEGFSSSSYFDVKESDVAVRVWREEGDKNRWVLKCFVSSAHSREEEHNTNVSIGEDQPGIQL